MQATPATWRSLIDAAGAVLQPWKILCGGEALPRDLLQKSFFRDVQGTVEHVRPDRNDHLVDRIE